MNDQPMEALDAMDERILQDVRELYARLDPVPAGLTDRIKFALTVQALNAEVAELTRGGAPAGMRSADRSSAPALTGTITFATQSRSIVISASETVDGRRRVDGWVSGGPAVVEVHEVGDEAAGREADESEPGSAEPSVRSTQVDDHGRFVFESLRPGPVYFVVRRSPEDPDERPVLTPTFTL